MIKEKISAMIEGGVRINKSKFIEDELEEILKRTSFLDDAATLSERCYNIHNNLSDRVTCKHCDNITTFLRISVGYREYCSCSCKNEWIVDNTDIRERISNSVNTYHKNLSKEDRRTQQNKRLNTMVTRNIITSEEDRGDYYNYCRLVWRYTNENDLTVMSNYSKRGRIEIDGTYQLDHKFSIFEGFKQNICPSIIGDINNLEFIPSRENSSKKQKCSITLEELMTETSKN